MNLTRPSLLVFARAARYLDTEYDWDSFDLRRWSDEEYTWRQDPWNGMRDFVQPPRETIRTGEGDCDDYALVAASWAAATDRDGLGMAVCGRGPGLHHMLAFDDEHTYSSGDVEAQTPGEYLDGSRYTWIYTRRVA